ncbi:MAG: sigma-70 family RNA polymerase sigma factor [Acidobacteria bacterium]|nr:sigma-70 family RNA polymerase sigma factor [Acidobacteriota bacterium]
MRSGIDGMDDIMGFQPAVGKEGRNSMSATQTPLFGFEEEPERTDARPSTPFLEEKLRAIAAGDAEAMASFYDATRSLVYGLALSILRNPADADEIAVDVYAQVWRTAGRFDPKRAPASAWLLLLTRSRALDRLRSAGNRARQLEQPVDVTSQSQFHSTSDVSRAIRSCNPEVSLSIRQQKERVQAAIRRLPTNQRKTIELAFFAGYTHCELAAVLRLPLGTVKTHVRSALSQLRAFLDAEPNFK